MYADDTQLYVPLCERDHASVSRNIELCVDAMKDWMQFNKLKLNEEET